MNEIISAHQLRSAAKGKVNESNMNSMLVALNSYGATFGLHKPHRLAHFLAQVMHESGAFRYDREIWGPTPAQKRYDTRTDLGNTAAADGDGKKNAGRGPIQLTGGDNIRKFYKWCKDTIGGAVPNFPANPDLINTDPWEGLSALFFWDTNGLNRWADQGDIETVTRRVNGGKNGLADRIDYYGRIALVLLGYRADNVRQFQADHRLEVDGDVGPRTRAALHGALVALIPGEMEKSNVQVAPVVEEKTVIKETTVVEEKPVVPVAVDTQVKSKTSQSGWLIGILGSVGTALTGLFGQDWQTVVAVGGVALAALVLLLLLRHQIIAAVKDIRGAVEQ